jgi:hypothetical protein
VRFYVESVPKAGSPITRIYCIGLLEALNMAMALRVAHPVFEFRVGCAPLGCNAAKDEA